MPRSPRRVQPGRHTRDRSPSSDDVRISPGGSRYRQRSLEGRKGATYHWVRESPSLSGAAPNAPNHGRRKPERYHAMYLM
jgi:hypothetical protein